MIKIMKLQKITLNELNNFGHNGYKSDKFYRIIKNITKEEIKFEIKLIELKDIYIKNWKNNMEDIENYNEIINENNSFGAYYNNVLIGAAICEERKWNNTLWIENIQVSEKFRGKNIGSLLINKLFEYAKHKKYRHIELETQNTNVPAIHFYMKQGFCITGFNLTLYNYEDNKEIAVYMIKNINDE